MLDPALRQALMRVNPEYFAWPIEAQECYRVSMPEHDAFRVRQELLKALFGIQAKTEEDLAEIGNRFGDKEHLEPISKLKPDVLNEYQLMILSNHHAYFHPNSIIPEGHGYTLQDQSFRKSILR